MLLAESAKLSDENEDFRKFFEGVHPMSLSFFFFSVFVLFCFISFCFVLFCSCQLFSNLLLPSQSIKKICRLEENGLF